MVAVEKAGIPAVGIAARSFARAWQSCVDGWGQPKTAFVTIPHATTGQQTDFIHKMVDEQIDDIIRGLTALPDSTVTAVGARAGSKITETFTIEMDETPQGLDAVNRFLAERDWSDGIPLRQALSTNLGVTTGMVRPERCTFISLGIGPPAW